MNTELMRIGIGSLAVGLLFVIFSRYLGVRFARTGRAIWKRAEETRTRPGLFGGRRSPSVAAIYDETKAPRIFRILGVVALVQAVVCFIFSSII
jgi:hypothetical protein